MIIMKKALPRRTFLRGLGATVALVKADSPLVADLAAAGWRPVAGDAIGVVLVAPR